MEIKIIMNNKAYISFAKLYTQIVDYLANMNTEPKYMALRAFFNLALPDLSLVLFTILSRFIGKF